MPLNAADDPRFEFRTGLILDERSDGVCVYLPSEGRGFVARGLTGHLLARLRDEFWDGTFGFADLDQLDGGMEAGVWRRLVKELCSRGAITRRESDEDLSGTTPPPVRAVGIVGDDDFYEMLQSDLWAAGQPEVRVFAEAGRRWDPARHLMTTWRDVALVVSFDSHPNAGPTRAMNRTVVAAGRRHLPVRTLGCSTEVGPLVVPGYSACFECYWWRRQAQFGRARSVSAEFLDGLFTERIDCRPDRLATAVARFHALVEVRRAVGLECHAPESLGAVITARAYPLSVKTRPVLRVHDCPGCASAGWT